MLSEIEIGGEKKVREFTENFDKSIKGKNILEIGCGGGLISELLAKLAKKRVKQSIIYE